MPPQHSQTLAETASSNSDRIIITFANDGDVRLAVEQDDEQQHEQSEHTDFPPESFWLSKDAELDWLDRNAFFDRQDSTKPNPNHSTISNGTVSNSNPSSQRFSVTKKSKTSIIGLPKPQQKPYFVDARHRRNQTNTCLFPKRGAAGVTSGKADAPMAEPSSPKVSCMGRVRSRRDRNHRRLKNRQQSLKKSSSTSEKPTTTEQRRKKKGLWKNLRSIFRSGSGRKPVSEHDSDAAKTSRRTRTATRNHVLSRDGSAARMSPPGLGSMARFSSGRRSDAWVGDVAEIRSGPLDGRSSLQKRREGAPLKEVNVNCGRDWGSAGPASV